MKSTENIATQDQKTKTAKYQIAETTIALPVMFVFFSALLEIFNYIYLGLDNGNGGIVVVPQYFLFDLGIMTLIASIIFVVKNKITQQIFYYIFVLVQVVLNIVNTTMYNIFGDILSWDLLKLGAEATTSMSASLIDWGG